MRFIGFAPAWRPGEANEKPSCLVVLDERGGIVANAFASGAEEIVKAVGENAGDGRPVLVGVDAPLSVPNERGTRKVEKVLSKLSLPAYSASRRMFEGKPFTEDLLAEFEKLSVEYTDYLFPRGKGRWAVEVDSAATLKVLSLERNGGKNDGDLSEKLKEIPESKFRKGNKEARAAALKAAIGVLWDTKGLRLRTGNLAADLKAEGNVDVSKLDVSAKLSHAELDKIVALVEGTLAAYTAHRHWKGRDGSMVVGLGDEGSVLLPANEGLQARIAEECRASKVPYV
jgi:predicted RNase H-like nuclease